MTELVLQRGRRYRVIAEGARLHGYRPVAPWTQHDCSIDLKPGDEIEYLGMHYSGGVDGVDVHQFRLAGDHPDAAHARSFRPLHPEASSVFDSRPHPDFLEEVA